MKLKKVSSSAPETRNAKNSLTKVKVGRVPDRGGRVTEMAAPPPEMPSWQQRSGQSHASTNYNKNQRGGGGGGGKDFLLHFVTFFHVASLLSTGVDNGKALELTNSTVFHRGRQ